MPDYESTKLTATGYPYDRAQGYARLLADLLPRVRARVVQLARLFHLLWGCLDRAFHFRATRSSPVVAGHDLPDCCLRYVVSLRQFCLFYIAFGIPAANLFYFFFRQLGAPLARTVGRSVARYGVVNVVGMCAKFQVVRAHAGRLIAFMANEHSAWYGAEVQRVGKDMRANPLPAVAVQIERSVIAGIAPAPIPAVFSFDDVGPESVNGRSSPGEVAAPSRAEASLFTGFCLVGPKCFTTLKALFKHVPDYNTIYGCGLVPYADKLVLVY